MFIFLKLKYLIAHSNNEITVYKTFINELIFRLSSIEKDFELMEKEFHTKFDTIIEEKLNILTHIYLDPLEKNEGGQTTEINETITKKSIYGPLHDALRPYLLPQSIREIVFKDFLQFYDEGSYAINERIHQIFRRFRSIVKATETFDVLITGSVEEEINNVSLETIQYRDLFYFINKLEQKLSEKFAVIIPRIRNILYGCNPKDVESQSEKIEHYYNLILYYKYPHFMRTGNIYEFVQFFTPYGRKLTGDEKAFEDYIRPHIYCFNKRVSCLYNYHKRFLKTFTLSTTRFLVYEKLLNRYEHRARIPSKLNEEDILLFNRPFLCPGDSLKETLGDVFFKFINYNSENYNENVWLLNKIKNFLCKCLRQELFAGSN